jgi:hypothetical protein
MDVRDTLSPKINHANWRNALLGLVTSSHGTRTVSTSRLGTSRISKSHIWVLVPGGVSILRVIHRHRRCHAASNISKSIKSVFHMSHIAW